MLDRRLMSAALPGYELGHELGRGGWGIVMSARHRALGRQVAIKQLPRAFGSDEATRQRFLNEAQTIAKLNHPHIVELYDFVEYEGLCLIIMELLERGTLWTRFTGSGIGADEACAVGVAVATALHVAHGAGVVHRDIKPENIFFGKHGVVKLGDFGIAKILDFGGSLTVAGETVGTPAYMSPEQARQKDVSPASDQYSLAVVIYEMLAGRLPFDASGDPMATLLQHVYDEPDPLPEDVPEPVAAVVMQALAKSPEDRFGSTESFAVNLALAANDVFGSRWFHHTGLQLRSGGRVAEAVARGAAPPRRNPTFAVAAVSEHDRVGTVYERDSVGAHGVVDNRSAPVIDGTASEGFPSVPTDAPAPARPTSAPAQPPAPSSTPASADDPPAPPPPVPASANHAPAPPPPVPASASDSPAPPVPPQSRFPASGTPGGVERNEPDPRRIGAASSAANPASPSGGATAPVSPAEKRLRPVSFSQRGAPHGPRTVTAIRSGRWKAIAAALVVSVVVVLVLIVAVL